MIALTPEVGTTPPSQVAVLDQFPVPAEVIPLEITTTAAEAALTHLEGAVAFAVIDSDAVKAVSPVFVQTPEVTVVVPKIVAPLYTVIVVVSASVLVPDTDVAPE
jgi:hypothetical protein